MTNRYEFIIDRSVVRGGKRAREFFCDMPNRGGGEGTPGLLLPHEELLQRRAVALGNREAEILSGGESFGRTNGRMAKRDANADLFDRALDGLRSHGANDPHQTRLHSRSMRQVRRQRARKGPNDLVAPDSLRQHPPPARVAQSHHNRHDNR